MEKYLTVKELGPDDRPDEKFLKYGASALTDAELLAIILRNGTPGLRSIDLARKILCSESDNSESILSIFDLELEDLQKIKGIGTVKAIQIKAVAELSKRIACQSRKEKLVFSDPTVIADYYMEVLRHEKKEKVVLLMLDSACALLKESVISEGTVNSSLFSPREIFLEALRYKAVNIILLHNHPSGNPKPSRADIIGTKKIIRAGQFIGITLLDHIIIGDRVFVSLRKEGYFNE